MPYKDITGQRFGRLVALYRQPFKKGGKSVWHCKCDCGNGVDVRLEMLTAPDDSKRSKTRSCGCLQKEYFTKPTKNFHYEEQYINHTFNGIKILSKTDLKDKERNILYNCQCIVCNHTFIAPGKEIKRGKITCPYCNSSINEKNIFSLLKNNNINFTTQQTFKTCKDNKLLPFDFYINNKYLLEYDGNQHFYQISNWSFETTRKHDLIKNKYCFDNNIPLIRIPYDAEYTIDDLKLETTKFLLTPKNEKEYYESRIV